MSYLRIITRPYIDIIEDLLEGKEVDPGEVSDALWEIAEMTPRAGRIERLKKLLSPEEREKLEEIEREFKEEIEKKKREEEEEEIEEKPIIIIKPEEEEEEKPVLVGLIALGLIIYLVVRR